MKDGDSSITKTESLRLKLTLVSLMMLLIALVVLDAVVYIGLHQRYYSDLRAKVATAAADANQTPALMKGEAGNRAALQIIANAISTSDVVAVVDAPGIYPVVSQTCRPSSTGVMKCKYTDARAVGVFPLPGKRSQRDNAWTPLRVAVDRNDHVTARLSSYAPANSSPLSLLFITSNRPAESALRRLLLAEMTGTLLVLGLAALAGGLVIKLTLRPLDHMSEVAGSINAGNLSRRLRPNKAWTELGKLATALDAMLDSLSASINSERHARERAASSEQRMRDFLSDASHELRTPIAALQWNAEALLLHGGERKRREELAFEIAKQAQRSSRLVDDLLQVARLDQGLNLEKRYFDLAKLAKEEMQGLAEREPQLDLRFSCEGDCMLEADPGRIRQVIANLIDNSRKALAGKGAIALTLRRRLSLIELELTDTGPGVAAADCERVFERFVRLNGSSVDTDSIPGSGLGLAIARGIAEAHGGKLVCVPNDRGARFVLTVPLGKRLRGSASVEPPVRSSRGPA
jgi:signal transduction histidine kinase